MGNMVGHFVEILVEDGQGGQGGQGGQSGQGGVGVVIWPDLCFLEIDAYQ